MFRGSRWLTVLLVVLVCLIANATLLDDFWRLAQSKDLGVAGTDIATHYLRMLHARDLYLPSGHRLGWDPYWFQGYVPFLLYPHLTYELLALLSLCVPIGPERLFNLYILAIYFALPLSAGLSIQRSLGAVAAIVATAWFCVLSTTGAGLTGVFVIGLVSQQVGVVLFLLLAIDLVVARRLDRAAIWLGLIPLVHVHASLVAGATWLCAGAAALADPGKGKNHIRDWLLSSALAATIGLPTAVGLVQGWGDIGAATTFAEMSQPWIRLLNGTLLVPQPTLVAICVCLFTSLFVAPPDERKKYRLLWCPLGFFLFVLSIHRWNVGVPLLDRILGTMLYIRTFPFAYAWIAVVAISCWQRFPSMIRLAVVVLSLASIVIPPHDGRAVTKSIGGAWRGSTAKHSAKSVTAYRSVLKSIRSELGDTTATLAIAVPRPRAQWLAEALVRGKQPLIGGHGIELTSVNNDSLLTRTLKLPCRTLRRQIRDYAIGYVVGIHAEQRARLESCFHRTARFVEGRWWAIATNQRWSTTPLGATGFRHDRTWTNLEWNLRSAIGNTPMRLPMARNSQWLAEVDGKSVAIEITADKMLQVTVPPGGKLLRLHYAGYPGEWATVVVSISALVFATLRARRSGNQLRYTSGLA